MLNPVFTCTAGCGCFLSKINHVRTSIGSELCHSVHQIVGYPFWLAAFWLSFLSLDNEE